MKLSYVLLQVALIAGGLCVYHLVVATSEHGSAPYNSAAHTAYGPGAAGRHRPAHGDVSAEARQNASRLLALERELARLRPPVADAAPASGAGVLPTLREQDQVDDASPQIDDRALDTLSRYLDEVQRRRIAAQLRAAVGHTLTRLELGLTPAQHEAVLTTTLTYREKVMAVSRWPFSPQVGDREARSRAFADLHDAYLLDLKRLVPAEAAAKIAGSAMTQGVRPRSSVPRR